MAGLDLDSGWGVQNGADAFASESSQWLDSDNDGYGDNLEGYQGDHRQFSRATPLPTALVALTPTGIRIPTPTPGA